MSNPITSSKQASMKVLFDLLEKEQDESFVQDLIMVVQSHNDVEKKAFESVKRGIKDISEGRVKSFDEVKKIAKTW
jgi:hypothetical protein